MTSVVESIHAQALAEDAALVDVVARAVLLASALGQKQVSAWLRLERTGYPDDAELPSYRRFQSGVLTAHQPGFGWVEAPITDAVNEAVGRFELRQGLAEIEKSWATGRRAGGQRLDLPEERQQELRHAIRLDAPLALAVPASAFGHVLDTVGIAIALWTGQLIQAGVAGQGTSFTDEEREAARGVADRLEELLATAATEAEQRGAQRSAAKAGLLARLLGKQPA